MSVKLRDGRRVVEVEGLVPGTPDDVWRAIATGPGVSAWFVPTEIEERVGGQVVSHFGPGGEASARITAWEPPHRFAAEGHIAPGAPTMATEWHVEARGSDACIVRVVHSLFADSETWDDQLLGAESGWPSFFRVLALYLRHFAGLPCAPLQVVEFSSRPIAELWPAMLGALGTDPIGTGCRLRSRTAPVIAGIVAHHDDGGDARGLVLRIDEPAPGIVLMGAHPSRDRSCVVLSAYLYGEQGAVAAADAPAWRAWLTTAMEAAAPA